MIMSLPIQRSLPALLQNSVPSIGQPQLGTAIAAILHELEILAVGNESVLQTKIAEQNFMMGQLVVETESVTGMTNAHHAAAICFPFWIYGAARLLCLSSLVICRPQRLTPERVFDISENQLLMLLLMLQSEFDVRKQRRMAVRIQVPDQLEHVFVNIFAISKYFIERRTRKQAATGTIGMIPDLFVIGVKDGLESLVDRTIPALVWPENEGLEKPCSMGQVPLGRTRSRHRLQHLIFRRKRSNQGDRGAPHLGVPRSQCLRRTLRTRPPTGERSCHRAILGILTRRR